MDEIPSTALVTRAEAPLVPIEYRFDLTRRSAFGVLGIGAFAGALLFLCGLTLGLSLQLEEGDAASAGFAGKGSAAAGIAPLEGAGSGADPHTWEGAGSLRAAEGAGSVRSGTEPAPERGGTAAGQKLVGSGRFPVGTLSPGAARVDVDRRDDEAQPRPGLAPRGGSAPRLALGDSIRAPAIRESERLRGGVADVIGIPVGAAGGAQEPAGGRASVPGAERFQLQVGVFRLRENAARLQAELRASGFITGEELVKARSGETLYRVLLGDFAVRQDAEETAARFRTATGREVYVMSDREVEW